MAQLLMIISSSQKGTGSIEQCPSRRYGDEIDCLYFCVYTGLFQHCIGDKWRDGNGGVAVRSKWTRNFHPGEQLSAHSDHMRVFGNAS